MATDHLGLCEVCEKAGLEALSTGDLTFCIGTDGQADAGDPSCVLLLLDYWPLGRLGSSWSELRQKYSKLLLEKVPLLSLAVASGLLAIQAQQELGALPSLQQFHSVFAWLTP